MRNFILAISLVGTLLFGAGFLVSFLDPLLVERAAREVVRIEVERKVGEKIDTLSNSRILGFAQKALQNTEMDIQRAQAALREEVPRRVANVVADMLRADCECRQRLIERLHRSEEEHLSSLTQVRESLSVIVESAYASATKSLMREFRIFSASNAVAFGLLGIVTLVRRRAKLQLVLPAFVLVGAVSITGGMYLFNQNWLHTIIFGQYIGFGYSLYLAAVALLLSDVAFNRARVTTQIVNSALNAVGAAASAVPC
nr:hypothetical protein [uncultured Rhodoferax sp.]